VLATYVTSELSSASVLASGSVFSPASSLSSLTTFSSLYVSFPSSFGSAFLLLLGLLLSGFLQWLFDSSFFNYFFFWSLLDWLLNWLSLFNDSLINWFLNFFFWNCLLNGWLGLLSELLLGSLSAALWLNRADKDFWILSARDLLRHCGFKILKGDVGVRYAFIGALNEIGPAVDKAVSFLPPLYLLLGSCL